MAVMSAEEVYEKYVKPLSVPERRRLMSLTNGDLNSESSSEEPRTRSLLELEGLGAHLWHGVDAQEYITEIRSEWDDRP